ncbi:hypothetical protein EUGRSUZ_K00195 [Eucalyptus grandis]|uniref:Uncharacterized protein n=2 Tax=Eucalyptus grandis TaxID=71139 RepID=A0ACC3IQV2_EUCGR|nr:hypothetical protein EUGRSUZ_K00195 [Eucalyptus grandis]
MSTAGVWARGLPEARRRRRVRWASSCGWSGSTRATGGCWYSGDQGRSSSGGAVNRLGICWVAGRRQVGGESAFWCGRSSFEQVEGCRSGSGGQRRDNSGGTAGRLGISWAASCGGVVVEAEAPSAATGK